MHFGSDNVVGASPRVLDALIAANSGAMSSYGEDDIAKAIEKQFSDIFETNVSVFLMSTGTAANGLALACMTPAWGEVFCHQDAHVMTDECGGPEQWTNGAKITPLSGVGGKITPATLKAALEAPRRGIHSVKPSSLSLTNLTECGTRYTPEETSALAELAKAHGLPVHLDGARFTNALVGGNATPAELTWKAGVDVLWSHQKWSTCGRGCDLLQSIACRNGPLSAYARRPFDLQRQTFIIAVSRVAG
jgi:threonine aldolase